MTRPPRSALLTFCLVLLLSLARGRTAFFNDPGSFWHIRLGNDILATGRVPRSDTMTVSQYGTPWVDQSWLYDVSVALVYSRGGWPVLAWLTATFLATLYAGWAWWLEARTGRWTAALVAALSAAGFGSVHYLTRPHMVTFAGMAWTLFACWAYKERGARWVWSMPGVVALWSNLHGGFVAGPLTMTLASLGMIIDAPRDRVRWRRSAIVAMLAVVSALATLLNPYGIGLYRHVWNLLYALRVTDLIQEYQPASVLGFHMRTLEVPIVLALVFAAWRCWVSRYDIVPALVWVHLALSSLRNLPLMGLALAPCIAQFYTVVFRKPEQIGSAPTTRWRHFGSVVLVVTLLSSIALAWGAGPSPEKWPLAELRVLNREPVDARLFHDQDWGGLIELQSNPRRLAWIDDRFELWGRQGILDYLELRRGGPLWDKRNNEFDVAWVRPTSGLAKRLMTDKAWESSGGGPVAILFKRKARSLPTSNPQDAGMDGERLAKIDAAINEAIRDGQVPGAVVVIGRRGKVGYRKAFGERSVEPEREPMTADSIFDLASLTKPIATATSVMILIDEGKLRLDDTIADVLPKLAKHGKGAITIEQLLRHRSGLIADNPLADYADGPAKAWEHIAELPLVHQPGEKFLYSDVNYTILGRMVAERGNFLSDFAAKRIFEPLGMSDTRFWPIGAKIPNEVKQRMVPTERDEHGTMLRGVVHDPRSRALGGVSGHAGLFGTADDLAVFCQMMLNEGVGPNGTRVLSAETVRAITDPGATPAGQKRGLGWDIETPFSAPRGERFGPHSFGHTGFTGTSIWIDPETQMFVILLTSSRHPDDKRPPLNSLRRKVATLAAESIVGGVQPEPDRSEPCTQGVFERSQRGSTEGDRIRAPLATPCFLRSSPCADRIRFGRPAHHSPSAPRVCTTERRR